MPLSLEDVLFRINPVVNDAYVGAEATYNNLGPEDQLQFIKTCFNIINEHNYNNFDRLVADNNKEESKSYFNYIKKCFVNARAELFNNSVVLRDGDESVIALFAKLALLKSLVTIFLSNKTEFTAEILKAIITASESLHHAYKDLQATNHTPFYYKGKVITSLTDFAQLNGQAFEDFSIDCIRASDFNGTVTFNASSPFTAMIYGGVSSVVFFAAVKYAPPEVVIALAAIIVTAMMYTLYLNIRTAFAMNNVFATAHAEQRFIRQYTPERPAIANETVTKHFIISQQDMKQLEDKLVSPRPQI